MTAVSLLVYGLLLSFASCNPVDGQSPQIVPPYPENINAVVNEKANVTCVVADKTGKNPTKIEFLKRGLFTESKLVVDEGLGGRIYYVNKSEDGGKKLRVTLHFNPITMSDNNFWGYECRGYTGNAKASRDFHVRVIENRNECLKNPCRNGGQCVNKYFGFMCNCSSGYQGKLCEQDINECLTTPCQNGGTCQNNNGGYTCQCPSGFQGEHCEQAVNAAYEEVGCFKDNGDRPLPLLIANFRTAELNWYDLKTSVIDKCANKAKEKGYTYFGIQFYGECWSGPNASKTYDRDGKSDQCSKGVGHGFANMVYRVV